MSIGWTDINPVLIRIFTTLATNTDQLADGFRAEWKEGKRGFTSPTQKLSLLLKVTTVAPIGEDETRYDSSMLVAQTGQRRVTLQVQAVVPEHTDEHWAMAAMSRIQTRIRRPAVIEELLGLDVGIIDVGKAVKISFKDGGRVVSSATMDIVFSMVAYDQEDTVAAGWIQYLVMSSHLSDGTLLADGQQMVNVEIPDIP